MQLFLLHDGNFPDHVIKLTLKLFQEAVQLVKLGLDVTFPPDGDIIQLKVALRN